MDRTLTILVDMDSIIVDFLGATMERYNKEYDDNLKLDDIKQAEFELNAKSNFLESDMHRYMGTPGFFRNMKPLPGALEGLRLLHDEGHDICIATSPAAENSYGEKVSWLKYHIPWLHKDDIMIGRGKWRLHGDILIDDYPRNITGYKKKWPDSKVFTIHYPYNKHADADFRAQDCNDTYAAWQQLCEAVDDVATGVFGTSEGVVTP